MQSMLVLAYKYITDMNNPDYLIPLYLNYDEFENLFHDAFENCIADSKDAL